MNPNRPNGPRVTIVMRTRNRPELLRRAIRDVFSQSFADLELVIVDDADSTDDVDGVVSTLSPAEGDKVVVVSRAGLAHGRWLAANAGLRAASGEYIVLHDDDDLWDPEFLSTVISHLDDRPELAATCVRTEIVIERPDAEGRLVRTDAYPFLPELTAITLMDMMRANRIPPISLVYRKALHDELGPYDESLNVLGDWEFYLRVLARHPIDLLDATLASWSHRPEDSGDAANSISVRETRTATDARIRDAIVRSGVEKSGIAPFMQLAHESQRLGEQAEARAIERLALDERLDARIERLERGIEALHVALIERTSLSHRLRRAMRLPSRRAR